VFTPDSIQNRVRQQPFVPLRITTSAGESFDILHADLIMVGRLELTVGTANPKHPTQYDDLTRIAIMHVASIKDLPAKAAKGNGSK